MERHPHTVYEDWGRTGFAREDNLVGMKHCEPRPREHMEDLPVLLDVHGQGHTNRRLT